MKTTYTNEQLQEAIDVAFHESSGDDGFWLGIARAFLDNLPKIHTPAEKPEPETFEAHGKTWTRYTPGDPMPCDGEAMVEVCIGEDLRKRPADKAINWNWEKWTPVRGWRYADETLVTKSDSLPEWTPQVGDVVRLKSGGPLMTVARLAEDDPSAVLCEWFDRSNRYDAGHITIACLKPSTKEDAR
jgi:uncharacterized protein YodC (DUF2158 family)